MRKINKIILILIIFIMIQLVATIFMSNKAYADDDSFFGSVFEKGKEWEEMGAENAKKMEDNEAKGFFDILYEIYHVVRVVGCAIFIGGIGIIGVGLIMDFKDVGAKIAEYKTTLTFVTIIAVLFIFAEPILNWIVDLFEAITK